MWEGFAAGISRENGKAGSIAVWLYGSNDGVEHYVYLERTNRFNSHHGTGHFNLKGYAKRDHSWTRQVLWSAFEHVAKDVGRFFRPLSTSYDERSGKIEWYDGESGRKVYFKADRTGSLDDVFVFGPYPEKFKDFAGHVKAPGLITTLVERTEKHRPKRIIIDVKDIYGQSLEHAGFEVESESGYSYAQTLPSNEKIPKLVSPNPFRS